MMRSVRNRSVAFVLVLFLCAIAGVRGGARAEDLGNATVPVATPIDTQSAGKSSDVAVKSVVHIACPKENWGGSGFLHKSGKIITAYHVVQPCSEILVIPSSGAPISATVAATDTDVDLALLVPKSALGAAALPISARSDFTVGTQVATWGFPGGYPGREPLLSVGYLAGVADVKVTAAGKVIQQRIVNAAFNGGNSGGPLLLVETGEVIGVVASKLAPISPTAASALDVLQTQQSGLIYEGTRPDGTKFNLSEGQVVGLVLDELRKQVQLVIGEAVMEDDLRNFLRSQHLEP